MLSVSREGKELLMPFFSGGSIERIFDCGLLDIAFSKNSFLLFGVPGCSLLKALFMFDLNNTILVYFDSLRIIFGRYSKQHTNFKTALLVSPEKSFTRSLARYGQEVLSSITMIGNPFGRTECLTQGGRPRWDFFPGQRCPSAAQRSGQCGAAGGYRPDGSFGFQGLFARRVKTCGDTDLGADEFWFFFWLFFSFNVSWHSLGMFLGFERPRTCWTWVDLEAFAGLFYTMREVIYPFWRAIFVVDSPRFSTSLLTIG